MLGWTNNSLLNECILLQRIFSMVGAGNQLLGMGRYYIFVDTPILTIPGLLERAASKIFQRVLDCQNRTSRQHVLIADTDTADNEKCADISDTDTGIGPSLSITTRGDYWSGTWKVQREPPNLPG